jgi:hypothetical protein
LQKSIKTSIALIGISLLLAGCAQGETAEDTTAISQPNNESIEDSAESDGLVIPLPSDEAKIKMRDVVSNSNFRFGEVGAVESYALEDETISFVFLPNYERGPAAFQVTRGDGEIFDASWEYSLNAFSVWTADRVVNSARFVELYDDIDTTIEYHVTEMPGNKFIIADDRGNSTTYFVENNLITGRELTAVDSNQVIGRSYIQYNVGQAENELIESLVSQTPADQLEALFSVPEE